MEECAHALGPDLQLLDGRRTEGIGRGDHDLFALHAGAMGQLGDGGGLAHAVDADEEHHFGRVHGADATRQTEDLVHFAMSRPRTSSTRVTFSLRARSRRRSTSSSEGS